MATSSVNTTRPLPRSVFGVNVMCAPSTDENQVPNLLP